MEPAGTSGPVWGNIDGGPGRRLEVTGRRRSPASSDLVPALATAIGGVLVVASFGLPWTSHGLASTVSGRELADLLLRGSIDALAPRWTGLALYLVPVTGALLIIGAGLGRRAGAWLSIGSLAVLVGAEALIAGALDWAPWHASGSGFRSLVLGTAVAGAGLVATSLGRRPT